MLKPIPDFPDYFASDDGEIWSMKPLGELHPKPNEPRKLTKQLYIKKKDRYYVTLYGKDKKPVKKKIAYLVLTAFVSKRPEGMYACHGIKGSLVDSLDNIYWATQSQNCFDKYRDGTMTNGERNSLAKLNELQVRIIRRAYSFQGKDGLSSCELAKIFNVGHSEILQVVKRHTWNHI